MTAWPFAPHLLLVPAALLINAVLAFWFTLGFALLAARFAPWPAMKKWVLLLPFARLAYDLGTGVPAESYVLSEFAGTRWDLGRFAFGAGWSKWQLSPTLELRLGALKGDQWYALSFGDACAHALFYRGAGWLAAGLLLCVIGIAGFRVARRVNAWRRFAAYREQGRDRRFGRLLLRRDPRASEGAFTSGVLRPVIWLPPRRDGLSARQRRAVLLHELAHVRHGDALLFAVIGVLRDLFFFIPGAGLLERRVHEAAERAADAWAVRHGASPRELAAALLSAAERRAGAAYVAAYAAGQGSTLERVRQLLSPRPAAARWRVVLGAVLSVALLVSALRSCFFGYG